MRRVLAIGGCGVVLLLGLPGAAAAAGGPVPPQQGGAGTSAPGGDVTYVAIAVRGGTLVQRVRREGGAVEGWRPTAARSCWPPTSGATRRARRVCSSSTRSG
jgi:hypothetical protein